MARVFDTPLITNDQSIDRVLQAGLPVLLIFLDGSSAALDPVLEQVARELAGQALVVKAPRKDAPQAAQQFHAQRFPALAAYKDGQVLSTAGAVRAEDIQAHAAYLLGRGPKPAEPQEQAARGGRAAAPGRPVVVNDANFEREVMQSDRAVLVDFWAPWCGPCRMTNPIVEKLAQELSGQLKVAKVNVDENQQTAGRYGVQSIPTMMVVKNGRVVDRWVGALPENAVRSKLAVHLT